MSRIRKKLNTRRVGHAGTLDPMATGVLVVMVGEATKLAPFLTADDKRYAAGVQLGRSTDSLDADGATVAEAPLPSWWPDEASERIEQALEHERQRTEQEPPVFSAIKIDGRAAHRRVRAGEEVALAARPVAVRRLTLVNTPTAAGRFDLEMDVAKGYYVRSLARDLGRRLDVPSHLAFLRRDGSGVFGLDACSALDEVGPESLIPIAQAATRALPNALLTPEGAARARQGAKLSDDDFETEPPAEGPCAWLDRGALVAVGERHEDGRPLVIRVFNAPPLV